MLTAHLSAGQRLQTKLHTAKTNADGSNGLPLGADEVIDPTRFKVEELASGELGDEFEGTLRDAAVRVDQARGKRGRDESDSLELWEALISGRWSMLDWFDSDQRRYVLAVPNPPDVKDPRGLMKRESQVGAYAAIGEHHKLIAYRLGISRSRVTTHLRSAMRKLGVNTDAQLFERVRGAPRGTRTNYV